MRSPSLHWLTATDPPDAFPDVERALAEPEGLLAAGGDLTEARLLYAYRHGIFPWYDDGQPILWWSPNPRCVIEPGGLHTSRRLVRRLRGAGFELTMNRAFESVVESCAKRRPGQHGTWITPAMHSAYGALHHSGWAHSAEVWSEGALVGGLYGVAIGRVFFGESMFSDASDASKAAMVGLCKLLQERNFALLDCQVASPHLLTMGATLWPRPAFIALLRKGCDPPVRTGDWPSEPIPIVIRR